MGNKYCKCPNVLDCSEDGDWNCGNCDNALKCEGVCQEQKDFNNQIVEVESIWGSYIQKQDKTPIIETDID